MKIAKKRGETVGFHAISGINPCLREMPGGDFAPGVFYAAEKTRKKAGTGA